MKEQKQYSAGIYCRLSKDDIGSGDSSSIISQKCILEKYVKDNGWTVNGCYIDDGYTGRNYDRPDFRRMIGDIIAILRLVSIQHSGFAVAEATHRYTPARREHRHDGNRHPIIQR